jgi:hypothetical protein
MIASKYGFASYRTLWNHPQNADLRKLRKNPNVLYPGDAVFIPDLEKRIETRSTDQHHKFVKSTETLKLRIVVKDECDTAIANTPCDFRVGTLTGPKQTNEDGLVEVQISNKSTDGTLIISGIEMPLRIGHLDPVEERSGQVARLDNLGYRAGPVAPADEALFESAVEEFQCDNHLQVDGVCGPKTQAKLVQVHGS